ncbi:Nramp family divalent metal transporter [Haloechinothrix sp. LS1_15]|uniref:Nramp family divalent metal transporter n=1 Tax=Haloechinothrix sp. LS1_15 TaxID=2652248 RepID=UPI002947705E|nr:Nramp family divalent metal transporter [Haloechinothrix sp. LS1_15]MDV6013965.1 divalent metal cation transporter [Haloechinothrix sp. LS1_15]
MPDHGTPASQPDSRTSSRPRGPRRLGPGLLVTAAFIGPGTVTTATIAGADFGFALIWALVFAIVTAIVLQEMAARLGIVSRQGLGEAMRTTFRNPLVSFGAIALVVAAIAFGNAAFQTGNLTGAGLGLEAITGGSPQMWAGLLGLAAFLLLLTGTYRWIERAVIVLVAVMSVVFIVTAVIVRPDVTELLGGLVPRVPTGATVAVIALIGTTVVPYNLFLHASSVREKWTDDTPVPKALSEARNDTYLSIGLGGLVTLAIITTAATVIFARGLGVEGAADMAAQLEPLLGPAAQGFFAVGLFAAGLTSAITAPLAAAYAVSGALGWRVDLTSLRFRAVWAVVILVGTTFAVLGENPVAAILFAQAANGLLLPIIAVFLLVVANRRDLLGEYRNRIVRNVLGIAVVLVATGLGLFNILRALGVAG